MQYYQPKLDESKIALSAAIGELAQLETPDRIARVAGYKGHENFGDVIRRLTQLETPDHIARVAGYQGGGDFGDMLAGYGFLLACYAHIHADSLSDQEKQQLYHAGNELWALASYFDLGHVKDRPAYVDAALASLNDTGEVLLEGGHASHVTLTRISRDVSGAYVMECYNAGDGSVEASDMMVRTVERFHLSTQDPQDIKTIIESLAEQRFLIEGSVEIQAAQQKIDRYKASPEPFDFEIAPGQLWGNCTTRCIREYLRDRLPETLFADVLNWVQTNGQGLAEHLNRGTDSRVTKEAHPEDNPLAAEIEAAINELQRLPRTNATGVSITTMYSDGITTDCFVRMNLPPLQMQFPFEGVIMQEATIREELLPLLAGYARESKDLSNMLGVHCELYPIIRSHNGHVDMSLRAVEVITFDAQGVYAGGDSRVMTTTDFIAYKATLTGARLTDEITYIVGEMLGEADRITITPKPAWPQPTFTVCVHDESVCTLFSHHGLPVNLGTALECTYDQLQFVLGEIHAEIGVLVGPLEVLVDGDLLADAEEAGQGIKCKLDKSGQLTLSMHYPAVVSVMAEALEIEGSPQVLEATMAQMLELSGRLYSQTMMSDPDAGMGGHGAGK